MGKLKGPVGLDTLNQVSNPIVIYVDCIDTDMDGRSNVAGDSGKQVADVAARERAPKGDDRRRT
jgi:hypothetical protein